MTDRQKMITGQAKEKGGFKYNVSPSVFREMQKQEIKPTKDKEKSIFPVFDELMEMYEKEAKETPKQTSKPTLNSKENTTIFPSFSKLMQDINNAQTKNNVEKDNQLEQLARDIESEYASEEQGKSYKNFGKRSAAASAKAAMENANISKASSSKTNVNVGQPNINVSATKETKKQNLSFLSNPNVSSSNKLKYMSEIQRKEDNNQAYKNLNSEMTDKYYTVNESDAKKVKNEIFGKPSKGEGYDGKDDYLTKMLDIVIESEKNYGTPITGYNIAFENNIASVRYNNKTGEQIVNQVYPKDKVEKNLKVLNSAFDEVNKDYDKYYDEGKKKGIKGKDLVLYAYDKIKYKINTTRNKIKAENDPRYKPLFK
jgi:hypothetical protein